EFARVAARTDALRTVGAFAPEPVRVAGRLHASWGCIARLRPVPGGNAPNPPDRPRTRAPRDETSVAHRRSIAQARDGGYPSHDTREGTTMLRRRPPFAVAHSATPQLLGYAPQVTALPAAPELLS